MALRFSSGLVKKMIDTSPIRTLMTGGKLLVFAGSQRTTADDAASTAPLLTITGITYEATGTGGILLQTVGADWSGTISTSGTAGWFCLCESADDGTSASTAYARIDGSVATSGGQMNLPSLALVAGAPFVVTDAAITFPKE